MNDTVSKIYYGKLILEVKFWSLLTTSKKKKNWINTLKNIFFPFPLCKYNLYLICTQKKPEDNN